jgi:hypothetical protein
VKNRSSFAGLIRAHGIFGDLRRFGRQFYTPAQFKRHADRSPRAAHGRLRVDFRWEVTRLDDDFGVRHSSSFEVSPLRVWRFSPPVLEAEAVVSGFENVATVGETIE